MQKYTPAIFIFLVGTIAFSGFVLYGAWIDTRGFSDTQEWNALVYREMTDFTPFVGDEALSLPLDPPPSNSSGETRKELAYLHQLVGERTSERLTEIEEEIHIENVHFNGVLYRDILEERPKTRRLFMQIMPEFSAIVLREKERFDRIRPSKLDKTLTLAIPLPDHPAYPSGHASQSKLIALILQELDPLHAEQYEADALRIAHNREIAGVHYPSDSTAGQALANAYFELLKENEEYKKLLADAREEW